MAWRHEVELNIFSKFEIWPFWYIVFKRRAYRDLSVSKSVSLALIFLSVLEISADNSFSSLFSSFTNFWSNAISSERLFTLLADDFSLRSSDWILFWVALISFLKDCIALLCASNSFLKSWSVRWDRRHALGLQGSIHCSRWASLEWLCWSHSGHCPDGDGPSQTGDWGHNQLSLGQIRLSRTEPRWCLPTPRRRYARGLIRCQEQ